MGEHQMRLGSACSGIGCIDLGLERAGFEPAWQIEIDPTCRAVLKRHWPNVERHDDLRTATDLPPVDLIAGGTPCQDLSVAGKGAGLDGERSGLFFDFIRLADSQPWAFVLWENVAGALSSSGGEDFAVCLEGFTGLRFEVPSDGWRSSGVAFGPLRWCTWRLLDAQHFGVAQRRRRLFVVAGPRGRCGPEVLLESEGLRGDPAAGGETGAVAATLSAGRPGSGRRQEEDVNIAGTLSARDGRGYCDDQTVDTGRIIESPLSTRGYGYDQVGAESQIITSTLASHGNGGGYRLDDREARGNQIVCHALRGAGHDASEDGSGRGTPLVVDEVPNLTLESLQPPCYDPRHETEKDGSVEVLRRVRVAIGEEAFQEWGLGVHAALRTSEVLRLDVHGGELPEAPEEAAPDGDDRQLPREEGLPSWPLRAVREAERLGRASQGQGLGEQLARELGENLPELPHQGASSGPFLHSLREASQGLRVLRQALSAVQEVGLAASRERQPAYAAEGGQGVRPRRLTPRLRECEALQGLPRNWTQRCSDGSTIADGPRYRMIGNGAAVPNVEWVGERIIDGQKRFPQIVNPASVHTA